MALVGQIVILEGTGAGTNYTLDKRHIFEVGRAASSVIRLDDNSVAMNHCRIYREEGVYTLYDLNSGIGTLINGQKIEQQELKTGDKVKIGNVLMHFKIEEVQLQEYTDDDAEGFSLDGFSSAWATDDGSVQKSEQYVEQAKSEPQPTPPPPVPQPVASTGLPRGRLTALEGEDKGKEFYLEQEGQYLIGRALEAHIKIMDIKSSRAHCIIERIGNQFFIQDNNSRNGTFLNGQKLEKKIALLPDQYVKVGFTVFKFEIV